jgi:hypothetical protein
LQVPRPEEAQLLLHGPDEGERRVWQPAFQDFQGGYKNRRRPGPIVAP